ncbi:hypothetical protein ABBQ32_006119 [Trebouxia sp. C0010 RCD-2024]
MLADAYRPAVDNSLLRPGRKFKGEIWALLIAGSGGWGNYRHQADVCHAYQILRHGGLPEENIVVMMADDIATSPSNPHPGQVFNRPGGPDVYDGVPIDYRGPDVTADNFLSVLAGAEPAVIGSSGKVIKSGPDDRVFVFYADHGAPGILGMPTGPFLYADQLIDTLHRKAENRQFADMVLYIEACEAGSMFEGLLNDSLNIYVTTAANAHESSWGTYCPGMHPSPPSEFTTCLGDLYSVSWMENSEHENLLKETLEKQFEAVKERVSRNGTYMQGSHVLQFGSLAIDEEPAADYLGQDNTGDGVSGFLEDPAYMYNVPQREAELLPLHIAVDRAPSGAAAQQAAAALQQALGARSFVDQAVRHAVSALLSLTEVTELLQDKYGVKEQLLADMKQTPSVGGVETVDPLVETLVGNPLPGRPGLPLVEDWDCLRGMVAAWEASCGTLDQYGMQHTGAFANLCNLGVSSKQLGEAACSSERSSVGL